MPNFLWGFQNNNAATSSTTPVAVSLPEIKPAGIAANSTGATSSSTGTTVVNVVRDFYWTYSPVGDVARAEVPRLILTERKLRTNALIAQLKYSLGQTYSGGTQLAQNIQQFGNSTGATAAIQNTGSALAKFLAGLPGANLVSEGVNKASQGAEDVVGKTRGAVANSDTLQGLVKAGQNVGVQVSSALGQAFADDNNSTVNSSPWLAPYRNLYLTDPTGWVYILPYFNNNVATQTNTFSDEGKTGTATDALLKPLAGLATEAAGVLASLNNPTQITYIEKTKFYNYPDVGQSISVEFPLINTGNVTYDDVVRNWQFLFLLLYQNRPGKTAQNTVDQPVIYQAEIPGTSFYPFCYMESINIEFMGSRRELTINIPSSSSTSSDAGAAGQSVSSSTGSTSIVAVIPDAYRVTLTLKSMIADSKNFMQQVIGPNQIVQTGVVNGTGSITTPAGGTIASTINVTPANGILNGLV
jgi:hypothetical protein